MTYDEPHRLQGRYVHVFVDPYIIDGRLDSATPIGRYTQTRDGASVPADFVTLQATALHAHFERFHQMDEAVGAKLKPQARIGVQSNVVDKGGAIRNNAIYDGSLDALLIVPYTDKQLPISINGGILAHEHFHMIYQSIVLNRLGGDGGTGSGKAAVFMRDDWSQLALAGEHRAGRAESRGDAPEATTEAASDQKIHGQDRTGEHDIDPKDDPIGAYNMFFLRAVNEGLADFWAWVYTGDTDFIGHSMPAQSARRRLDPKVDRLDPLDRLQSKIVDIFSNPLPAEVVVNNAYEVGTNYARALRELATQVGDTSTFEGRMAMAKILVHSLSTFADDVVEAQSKKTLISPNAPLKALTAQMSTSNGTLKPGGSIDAANSTTCRVLLRVAAPEADSFAQKLPCRVKDVSPSQTPSPSPTPSAAGGMK